ncbi:MAG: hypothetical protein AAF628_23355, partial [Planctomycetota bacterium]
MRTLQLLTRAADARPGTLRLRVRTGPITSGGTRHENTWRGFLIGVGGAHVDDRISALCHHWPAIDGGLIAALDGTGRTSVLDQKFLCRGCVTGRCSQEAPTQAYWWIRRGGATQRAVAGRVPSV